MFSVLAVIWLNNFSFDVEQQSLTDYLRYTTVDVDISTVLYAFIETYSKTLKRYLID